jgi:hypothetical protein
VKIGSAVPPARRGEMRFPSHRTTVTFDANIGNQPNHMNTTTTGRYPTTVVVAAGEYSVRVSR